jgi:SAM-dependent methyltransferase
MLLMTTAPFFPRLPILDVAPTKSLTRLLGDLADRSGSIYVRTDLDPRARAVDVAADLTCMPFDDRSCGVVVCYHVLEHVPEDAAAMREIARVLSGDGLAFIQVPWRPGTETDEDPDASVDERLQRFGQADHVRMYGRDFETRLSRAGLRTVLVTPSDVLDELSIERMRLVVNEPVWIAFAEDAASDERADRMIEMVRQRFSAAVLNSWAETGAEINSQLQRAQESLQDLRSAVAEREGELDNLRQALDAVVQDLDVARAESMEWAREAEQWKSSYLWLRSRMPVRAMAVVARAARKAKESATAPFRQNRPDHT